ncbi:MAG: phosphotransferase [Syntrophomonadaceae bacterium]
MSSPDAAGLVELARRWRGPVPPAVETLAGDVGRRRYYRLRFDDGGTAVGVAYPAEEADARRRWIAAHAALSPAVRVPALLADDERGHQIVEDLGDEDLAARLIAIPGERMRWLDRAVDAAAAIAALPDPGLNPPFDAALFRRELELAREAVFDLLEGRPLSASERAAHDAWADALVAEILRHPVALCHRDFHGNNLFAAGERVGVIDFQDLRLGPDAYDLASLLWERATLGWMSAAAAERAIARFAAARGIDPDALSARLSRVLLQRAWKAAGTFSRAIVHGKGEAYRRYLPGELDLVRRLLSDSPEDRAFRAVLDSRRPQSVKL